MMEYLFAITIGIIFGSIPSAYIVLKLHSNKNVTEVGSGNVGARNVFDVTGSFIPTTIVFIMDAGKGLLTVFLIKILTGNIFEYAAIGLLAAVTVHNFNPWLKFKGGRGLATSAGGLAYLAPVIILIWAIVFVIAWLFRKNIHFGNGAATLLTLALSLFNSDILNKYSMPPAESDLTFAIIISLIMTIVFIRHIGPLKEWFRERQESIRRRDNESL